MEPLTFEQMAEIVARVTTQALGASLEPIRKDMGDFQKDTIDRLARIETSVAGHVLLCPRQTDIAQGVQAAADVKALASVVQGIQVKTASIAGGISVGVGILTMLIERALK